MEASGFFDAEQLADGSYDMEYYAEQFANYFSLFVGNGVFASPTDQLKIIASDGLNIIMKQGWAFIDGYWYYNDSDRVLSVTPNTTAITRNDAVFIQLNTAERKISSVYAAGRTERNTTAPIYELKIASFPVVAGATGISDSDITDHRADNSVCGFVTGLIDVISTENLFSQYNAIFNEWFDTIKGQLDGDVAGNLLNKIEEVESDLNEATSVRNLKTYTSLSQLGLSLDDVTSHDIITLALGQNAVISFQLDNAQATTLYNNGIIPLSKGGKLEVANIGGRSEYIFTQSQGIEYRKVLRNYIDLTPLTWMPWKKVDMYIELTGTLTAGETTITLTDDAITIDSTFSNPFTTIWGVNPTEAPVVTDGSITYTFDAQDVDMGVKVKVM